jgi:multidrug efflux pump subunit AcrB
MRRGVAAPSATVSALVSLKLFNLDLTMMAIIGLIMLIGIVKKNAIMDRLSEFAARHLGRADSALKKSDTGEANREAPLPAIRSLRQ